MNRQRSVKSSKRNPSRQGTGITFATDRCITSPLSIHGKKEKRTCVLNSKFIDKFVEEAERLLVIDSPKQEEVEDNMNNNNNGNKNDKNDSGRTTGIDPVEEILIRDQTRSPITRTDEEHGIKLSFFLLFIVIFLYLDQHIHPSAMNLTENSIVPPSSFDEISF